MLKVPLFWGKLVQSTAPLSLCPGGLVGLHTQSYGGPLAHTHTRCSRVMIRVRGAVIALTFTPWHSKAVLCTNFPPKIGTLK